MKIVNNTVNTNVMYGIIFSIVLSVGISCASRGKVGHKLPTNDFITSSPPVVTFVPRIPYKQDTTRRRHLSDIYDQTFKKQVQEFMERSGRKDELNIQLQKAYLDLRDSTGKQRIDRINRLEAIVAYFKHRDSTRDMKDSLRDAKLIRAVEIQKSSTARLNLSESITNIQFWSGFAIIIICQLIQMIVVTWPRLAKIFYTL